MRRARVVSVLVAGVAGVAACGEDQQATEDPPAPAATAPAATSTPQPATATPSRERRARKRKRRPTPTPTLEPREESTPTPTAQPPSRPAALTRSQLIARGDRICREYGKDLEKLEPPEAPEERAAYYARAANLAEETVSKLERLRPPPARRATFIAYVELLRENASLVRDLSAAIEGGDTEEEKRISRRLPNRATRAARLARRYGFRVCGGPA